MSGLDYKSGDKIAEAIDRRIVSVAKQVYEKSPNNKTKYGKVLSKKDGLFTIEIEKAVYPNVPALRNVGTINVGEIVVCMVPNNQFSNIMILGVSDGTLITTNGSEGGGSSSINVVDNLSSTSTTDALSANQGNILNKKINNINDTIKDIEVITKTSELTNDGDGTSPFATEDFVSENGGKIDSISVNGVQQDIDENKNVDLTLPTKVSQLENDSEFINKSVNNLDNYYDKTQTEILVNRKFTLKVVSSLPAAEDGDSNTIYVLKSNDLEFGDYLSQYILRNGTWEMLSTQLAYFYAYEGRENSKEAQTVASEALSKANEAKTIADEAKTIADEFEDVAREAHSWAKVADTNATTAISLSTKASEDSQTALDTANEAKTTAETAKTTADEAKTTAETADTNANTALENSETAITTANSAVNVANNAGTVANQAKERADEAYDKSETATSSASNAYTLASEAKTTSETANTTANEAKTTANEALEKANSVQGAIEIAEDAKTVATNAGENAIEAINIANSFDKRVTTAETNASNAKSIANEAKTLATNASETASSVSDVANEAKTTADEALETAKDALEKAGSPYEAVCSVLGTATKKTVSIPDFPKVNGSTIDIYFENANTAQGVLTLSLQTISEIIEGTIYIDGSTSSSTNYTLGAGWHTFYYNGSVFYTGRYQPSGVYSANTATKATQDSDGNKISTTYVKNSKVVNTTDKTLGNSTGWDSANYGTNVPALNTLAYWDGRYAGDMTRGNLAYCNKGAFGDIVTKNLSNDINFTGDINDATTGKYCTAKSGSTVNRPYHRIAHVGPFSASYTDAHIVLLISKGFNGGGYGILDLTFRTDRIIPTSSTALAQVPTVSARWLVLYNLAQSDVTFNINYDDTTSNSYGTIYKNVTCDVFYKISGTYNGIVIKELLSDYRGTPARRWTLVDSNDSSSTSYSECWATQAEASTALRGGSAKTTGNSALSGNVNYSVYADYGTTQAVGDNSRKIATTAWVRSYICPAGTVMAFAGSTTPSGWLLCDGSAVSRTTYSALYSAIGTTYGTSSSTTFNLPKLNDNRFIEGSTSGGTQNDAGIPNIQGKFAYTVRDGPREGAFSWGSVDKGKVGSGSTYDTKQGIFNASLGDTGETTTTTSTYTAQSNSVYGKSPTVQPKSLTMRYIIKY